MIQGTRQADTGRDPLRVVVVGAGVTGLLAASRCVLAGHRVVLLERGPIPHPGSTSFDQHRALRALVAGDPAGTSRTATLHREWRELDSLLRDNLSGALYRRVGVLTALPPDELASAIATAEATGLPVRIADPVDYPHIGFPAGAAAVFEPHAGVLLADRILRAAARWLRQHPRADLRPGRLVVGVRPDSSRVLLADGTAESGDVVLVTAGPWSAALMDLPVTLHCQTMVYLRPPAQLVHHWAGMPIAGGIGADGRAWLLPSVAGTQLKISTDEVRREVTTLSDPGEARTAGLTGAHTSLGPDPGEDAGWAVRVLSAGIVSEVDRYDVVRVRHCHYATAAGGHTSFVRVGPAVWARPASGGDGFRTAPQAVNAVVRELTGQPAAASIP